MLAFLSKSESVKPIRTTVDAYRCKVTKKFPNGKIYCTEKLSKSLYPSLYSFGVIPANFLKNREKCWGY